MGFYKKTTEKRKYPRVPISVRVVNITSGNFSYYLATNISRGGMFLKSAEPLAEGTDLTLQFELPDQEKKIQLKARVLRNQKSAPGFPHPSGMGVKFTELEDQDKAAIQKFVERKT
ncbi:MAG: TIGR02266 family protein [bacterium]